MGALLAHIGRPPIRAQIEVYVHANPGDSTITRAPVTIPLLMGDGDGISAFGDPAPTGSDGPMFVPGGSGGLKDPRGLAFGPGRKLYVVGTDGTQGHIYRYDGTTGAFVDILAAPVDASAFGLVVGPDGDLYVSNIKPGSVSRFNTSTGALIGTFVASRSGGLASPRGLAFGPDGDLYVASPGSAQVLRYNGTTGAFVGVFAAGVDARGLAFGPDENLYVADYLLNQVLRFKASTGVPLGVFAAGGGLDGPVGIAFGPDGRLYVSSYNNGRLIAFDSTTGALIGTVVSNLRSPRFVVFPPKTDRDRR